ncbi:MAG: PD-(D/E)XK motif protein [Actinomycetota bacterium]|nr:PD-(D/E)XK motif protein [Actinomycetota bacterium]
MSDSATRLDAELNERWENLEAAGATASGGLHTIDIPVATHDGDLLLGAGPGGRRLLVPLAADQHATFKEDRRSSALLLLKRQLERNGALWWYADLSCPQPQLNHVFVALIVDVLARIEVNPDKGLMAMRRCMTEWRALFASRERVLTVRELAGLFGELMILQRLLERDPDCLELWRGPLHEPHDFSNGIRAVEVKASLADEGHIFQVHGLEQLQPPPTGSLLLAHLRIAQTLEEGSTVPDLVATCRELSATGGFGARIEGSGYNTEHEESYRKISFELLEQSWFEVVDDFPRIVPESFGSGGKPEGITAVAYDVDLAGIAVTPLSEEAVEAHLVEMLASK